MHNLRESETSSVLKCMVFLAAVHILATTQKINFRVISKWRKLCDMKMNMYNKLFHSVILLQMSEN